MRRDPESAEDADRLPEDLPEELKARLRERAEKISKLQADMDRANAFERAQKVERIATGVKLTAMGIGAIVILAGAVWGVNKLADLGPEQCQFHEHATFRVVDGGQDLSFRHNEFDMRGGPMPMRAHLHQPNDYQVHLDGGCADVREFFSFMKMKIDPGYLRLDEVLHGGRVLENDGNETLRFYLYQNVAGNWTWQPYSELLGHQLRDQQRMLVAYGNYTADELADMQARVPGPGSG